MARFKTPLTEVEYSIGKLYETILVSNLKLTDSVNNMKVTVENLMASDLKVKDIVSAQSVIENRYKKLANL